MPPTAQQGITSFHIKQFTDSLEFTRIYLPQKLSLISTCTENTINETLLEVWPTGDCLFQVIDPLPMFISHGKKSTNISICWYSQALSSLLKTWLLASLFFVRTPTLKHVFILTTPIKQDLFLVSYPHLWRAVTFQRKFQTELCKWTL